MDLDLPRLASDAFTAARQLIQPLAVMLEGRVHGWNLQLLPLETGQYGIHRCAAQCWHLAAFDDRRFAVERDSACTQLNGDAINLGCVEQPPTHFGSVPEAHWQQS
jgi:hypothetical protein